VFAEVVASTSPGAIEKMDVLNEVLALVLKLVFALGAGGSKGTSGRSIG
jgi:hypothetical protein